MKAEDNLRTTLAVDQNWMLSTLARQEGGIKFLIDIRADILVSLITFCFIRFKSYVHLLTFIGSNRIRWK